MRGRPGSHSSIFWTVIRKGLVSAVLLQKQHDRCVGHDCIKPSLTDNIALSVEDEYVFGFGMDYNGQYRQLDSIYAAEEGDK